LIIEFEDDKIKESRELFTRLQELLEKQWGRNFKDDLPFKLLLNHLDTNKEDYLLAIRTSIKRTTVFLRRSTNASFVNGYNRKLLEAWGANIDVQFVLDTYACAKYCVGYILKAAGGVSKLLRAAVQSVKNGNLSIPEKLRKYANVLINGTEISAQEAAAFLLGIPNTFCSRQDLFINTAHPDERIHMLKVNEEIDKLGEDSEDICEKGLLDHYSQRPEELEEICLAEFASMYEYKRDNSAKTNKKEDEQLSEHGKHGKLYPLPNMYKVLNKFLYTDDKTNDVSRTEEPEELVEPVDLDPQLGSSQALAGERNSNLNVAKDELDIEGCYLNLYK
jgi:hypothetical protein